MNLKNQNINTILSYVKQITVPQLSYLWVQAKDGFERLSPPIVRFTNMKRGVLASLVVDHWSLIEPIVDNLVPVGVENQHSGKSTSRASDVMDVCDVSHLTFDKILNFSCSSGCIVALSKQGSFFHQRYGRVFVF